MASISKDNAAAAVLRWPDALLSLVPPQDCLGIFLKAAQVNFSSSDLPRLPCLGTNLFWDAARVPWPCSPGAGEVRVSSPAPRCILLRSVGSQQCHGPWACSSSQTRSCPSSPGAASDHFSWQEGQLTPVQIWVLDCRLLYDLVPPVTLE